MTVAWDSARDKELTQLVERVIGGDRAAWRALMVATATQIEAWAKGNRVLRRCRLSGDDDTRAVMVDVLERLAADDHANLKKFVARAASDAVERDLVDEVVRLGRLDDNAEPEREDVATPLRAWLIRLVDFAARDHVRDRLGWGTAHDKRKVGSGAAPLSEAGDHGMRPPMTDKLSMSRFVGEVREYLATFPADMREAVMLWLDEVDVEDIGSRLNVDAAKARALVRAGQARLREKFRGRSPLLFS